MVLREKVRKAFHRHPKLPDTNGHGIKIEYYKPREVPRSKFRGPVDPDHQKRLAAWNFPQAMEDRPRSPGRNLALSPCATIDQQPQPHPRSQQQHAQETETSDDSDIDPEVSHCEYANRGDSGSSTAVDSDPDTDTTLPPPPNRHRDSIARIKNKNRQALPKQQQRQQPLSPKTGRPLFAAEDLNQALNNVQICT